MSVAALAGGVGAAKFLRGLSDVVDRKAVTIIGNTGDDEIFHGLHVSPDLDTVAYTLAGIVDPDTGWGVEGDTAKALERLRGYGIDAWFQLKDSDLGTHLARTQWLSEGLTLSQVTFRIRTALGLEESILPMSDQRVRTLVSTEDGVTRPFQEYFVRFRHTETVTGLMMLGADSAEPAPGVVDAIEQADRVIVCPSNPFVSIGPILAVRGIREALTANRDKVVAISPIVKGEALKGPAADMLRSLGHEANAAGVAALYEDFCGLFVLDYRDAPLAARIEERGMRVMVVETVMATRAIAAQLAKEILAVPIR